MKKDNIKVSIIIPWFNEKNPLTSLIIKVEMSVIHYNYKFKYNLNSSMRDWRENSSKEW